MRKEEIISVEVHKHDDAELWTLTVETSKRRIEKTFNDQEKIQDGLTEIYIECGVDCQ